MKVTTVLLFLSMCTLNRIKDSLFCFSKVSFVYWVELSKRYFKTKFYLLIFLPSWNSSYSSIAVLSSSTVYFSLYEVYYPIVVCIISKSVVSNLLRMCSTLFSEYRPVLKLWKPSIDRLSSLLQPHKYNQISF